MSSQSLLYCSTALQLSDGRVPPNSLPRLTPTFGLAGVHHGPLSCRVAHLVLVILLAVLAALHALVVGLGQLVVLVLVGLGPGGRLGHLLLDYRGGGDLLDIVVMAHTRPLDAGLGEGGGRTGGFTQAGGLWFLGLREPGGFRVVGVGGVILAQPSHSQPLCYGQEGVEVVLLDVDFPAQKLSVN